MYGKIFEDIFCSTLMDFGGDTAYVFIAMIVLSDEHGILKHTAESLARVICKDAESVRKAISHLESPDQNSNLKTHEGRRIVPLCWIKTDETRGWLVVNKSHYRDQGSKDDRRDYMREYMRKLRNLNNDVNNGKQRLAQLTHTDTDTDTDTKAIARKARNSPADDSPVVANLPLREGGEFAVRQSLVSELEPIYPHVDVPKTLLEMRGWLLLNQERRKTYRGIRRFIGNWLQSEEEKHGG